MNLLIYTPETTSRINYCLKLIFDTIIKTPYFISNDKTKFKSYEGPKINYSSISLSEREFQIIPYGLLSESGIKPQPVEVTEWNGLKIFFTNKKGNLPFDIFSASFYLVSRYEEYLSLKHDEHDRFHHSESLAYKNNFLNEPLINLWAEELKKLLIVKFTGLTFSENKYSFLPTIDIDIAYAHLGRSPLITAGSIFKLLSRFQFGKLAEKILVLTRLQKDPFDTYQRQEEIFKKYRIHPVYFILAAGTRKKFDKNISTGSSRFKNLVKKISAYGEIGIHPSYQSNSKPEMVKKEIKSVEINITKKITCSRQHFLRIKLPGTYQCLAASGITDDYSMAYAGAPGFRAGICTPFYFYDLEHETELPVKVHSAVLMDGTITDYQKIPAAGAIAIVKELIAKIKKCNGEFIFIWHNHTISGKGQWKALENIFEEIIELGIKN